MKRTILRMILLSSLLLLYGVAAHAESPRTAVGNWKLDLNQSSYGKAPAPKFEKLNIFKDSAAAIKWMITGASSDGKTFTVSYDGPVDGQFHPVVSSEGGSVAYKREAAGRLHWTIKDKSGNIIESAGGELSPDGNTLTLKGTLTSPEGSTDFVSVFTRMQ
jgi:hypothetical protein